MIVRVKGDPLHPECFKCASCGLNLRNQGNVSSTLTLTLTLDQFLNLLSPSNFL